MIHFRDKMDLVEYIEKRCARASIVRAISEGDVELYGGFRNIPPMHKNGWILRVTSVHDRTWYVVILSDKDNTMTIISSVPWSGWIGDAHAGQSLFEGDNPDDYEQRKAERIRRCRSIKCL